MLQALGLSTDEQSLYELLLTRSPVTADELGEPAALRRLEDLGLGARVPGEPLRYAAVPPETGLGALVAARERSLTAARRRMNHLAVRHRRVSLNAGHPELFEIVYGYEAKMDWYARILRSAHQDVGIFDSPPYFSDPYAPNSAELEQLGRGVRFRVLYDRRGVDMPGRLAHIDSGRAAGENARVADVPFKLLISDHAVAMLPASSDPAYGESWLVVRDSVLIDALATLFETLWERGVPLHVAEHFPGTPDETDRALLSLLTAGLTDQAIAAHFGWHERTAHRRLREMMTRLDAATRFQAGYQAVRRGWLTEGAADE